MNNPINGKQVYYVNCNDKFSAQPKLSKFLLYPNILIIKAFGGKALLSKKKKSKIV